MAPAVKAVLNGDPNIRIVYKEFAILGPQSLAAAKAALAAHRQGKYRELHEALMASSQADEESALAFAKQLGLDVARLRKDMKDPAIAQIIERNYQIATALGINGTPAFIIGNRLVPGAIDADAMAEIVREQRALNKAGPKIQ